MADYDSDSSDGGDYTETNVLLGYASKEADADEDTISKIGGYPVCTLSFNLSSLNAEIYRTGLD